MAPRLHNRDLRWEAEQCLLLLLSALILAAGLLGGYCLRRQAPAEDADEKLLSSELYLACQQAIYAEKLLLNIPMDPAADPNRTGLIGQEYTFITTTLGNLEAKRTAANPNMAALFVQYFHELGLQAGDRVAMNFSGSFPSMDLAVLCAAETLSLEPVLLCSVGASTHGANDPELTFPDMLRLLNEQGLLRTVPLGFSMGGLEDRGEEMPEEVKAPIIERLKGYGLPFLTADSLEAAIWQRYALYNNFGTIKCFVNVGGNGLAFGESNVIVNIGGGILRSLPPGETATGLVQLFLKDGVPVVHVLNIRSLAADNGLPIDPVPLPAPGDGPLYTETVQPLWPSLLAASAALLLLWRKRAVFRRGKGR